MSEHGWIKLHRKIRENPFWEERPFDKARAWIDVILSANHEPNRFLLGNEMVSVERGSYITSEKKLMEKWGWSKSKVRAFLNLLEKQSMIVKTTDSKKTTLEVLNYCIYQDSETTKEPQKNRTKTTKEPDKDTNNKDKELQEGKEKSLDLFESVWKLYPKKEGKGQVSKGQIVKLNKIGVDEITRAIKRYTKAKEGVDKQYLQNGSTFFNSGYVDYLDANYKEDKPKREGTVQWR